MATLNIEGRRVKIDDGFLSLSPEDQERTVGEIASSLGIQAQPQTVNESGKVDRERSLGETLTGYAGQIGSGLAEHLAGLAGLPGDLERGADWLAKQGFRHTVGRLDNLARTGEATAPSMDEMYQREAAVDAQNPLPVPTPKDVISSNQTRAGLDALAGPLPEPQTTGEQYARTISQFAPAAILAPGTALRKAAFATVPGAASETAGQATEGTEAEPFARAGAALLGGLATAGGQGRAVSKAVESAPSTNQIKRASQQAFDEADQIGFQVKPAVMDNFVQRVVRDAKADGLHAKLHPKTTAALETIVDEVIPNPSLKNLHTARKLLGQAASSIEPAERRFASIVIDRLDNFMESLHAGRVISGDPEKAVGLLKKGIEGWAQFRKAEMIENAIELAKTQASGFENGLRIQFRQILRNPKKLRGFTEEEKRALRQVVGGTSAQNILTMLGRFGFDISKLGNKSSFMPGALVGGTALSAGVVPAAALAGAGSLAKVGARMNAGRLANRAQAVTRMSKADQARLTREREAAQIQATLKRLLATDTPRRSSD